jgi:hypothetical protein
MKKLATMAAIGLLVCAGPALGGNSCPDGCSDGDGVSDNIDNCIDQYNAVQDDTDGDDCGNICDADYDQSGAVGFGDFGYFTGNCFGKSNPLCDHIEPIDGNVLGFGDFGAFTSMFGTVPGPSGTTAGTIPCP